MPKSKTKSRDFVQEIIEQLAEEELMRKAVEATGKIKGTYLEESVTDFIPEFLDGHVNLAHLVNELNSPRLKKLMRGFTLRYTSNHHDWSKDMPPLAGTKEEKIFIDLLVLDGRNTFWAMVVDLYNPQKAYRRMEFFKKFRESYDVVASVLNNKEGGYGNN